MIEGTQIVRLCLKAATRLKMRSRYVGPFPTFSHAAAWVDDNVRPEEGEDYCVTPLNDPVGTLQVPATCS